MGFWNEKHSSTAASTSVASMEPLRTTHRDSGYLLSEFEKKDLAYKKRIRILRFISRLVSLILNALVMGTLSYALAKYFLTRNHVLPGGTNPWITPTTLWPSLMLLGIATVTFILNAITLFAYCCGGVQSANKASTVTSVAGYIFLAAHLVAWVVAAGLYRYGRTGNDLWGYSCSDKADAVQEQVQSFLDFGKLCTMQQGTWFISIIEAGVYLLTLIVTIFMVRRASTKKKLGKIRESLSMQTEYAHTVEMGSMHNTRGGNKYMPLSG
ncbi:hypothetical protein G7Y89_g13682 [Cudoniella acicularis]|uniref:MARVEL domain-containing protein n=1 Tax=Cudoniella acicularis TaxID=354080 RepID=A0A8H4R967_9HELO|nr:hypothetical protein G7Y89_g13682 [Cudoniella acicularis]